MELLRDFDFRFIVSQLKNLEITHYTVLNNNNYSKNNKLIVNDNNETIKIIQSFFLQETNKIHVTIIMSVLEKNNLILWENNDFTKKEKNFILSKWICSNIPNLIYDNYFNIQQFNNNIIPIITAVSLLSACLSKYKSDFFKINFKNKELYVSNTYYFKTLQILKSQNVPSHFISIEITNENLLNNINNSINEIKTNCPHLESYFKKKFYIKMVFFKCHTKKDLDIIIEKVKLIKELIENNNITLHFSGFNTHRENVYYVDIFEDNNAHLLKFLLNNLIENEFTNLEYLLLPKARNLLSHNISGTCTVTVLNNCTYNIPKKYKKKHMYLGEQTLKSVKLFSLKTFNNGEYKEIELI